MTSERLEEILSGGDRRSIGHSEDLLPLIDSMQGFDRLFEFLFHNNNLIVMRTADAVEKITREQPGYLQSHKEEIFELLESAYDKELKWHLAQLISRIELNEAEIGKVWLILTDWAIDPKESRIVRTNSIHALFNLLSQYPELEQDFQLTVERVEKENIPSINARMRILKIINRGCK